jgi:hypothetical protein
MAGIEPANSGFADHRVSHFATSPVDLHCKTRDRDPIAQEVMAGIEPANSGFADHRVSHFATSPNIHSPSISPGKQNASAIFMPRRRYLDSDRRKQNAPAEARAL